MADEVTKSANLLRVYLRDCSLESPNTPASLATPGESQFKLDVSVTHRKGSDNQYEVTLTLQARAINGEQTMFLIEVQQAGLMQIVGIEGEELDQILGAWVPQQLYPFARAVVGSLSMHAGFPQVMLPIVDFQQFYLQNKAQKTAAGVVPPADPPQGPKH